VLSLSAPDQADVKRGLSNSTTPTHLVGGSAI
jgi:hypothetical protein